MIKKLFQIARLEELQRLQEQYPGLVIREVPNKPPPPYTPPTSTTPSSASSVSPSTSPTMPPAYSVATPRGDEVPLKSPSPVNTIRYSCGGPLVSVGVLMFMVFVCVYNSVVSKKIWLINDLVYIFVYIDM